MALHDTDVHRFMAFGVAGLSVLADSLSAIKYAEVRPVRDENGYIIDFTREGGFPKFGNDDDRVDSIAANELKKTYEELKKNARLPRRGAYAVGAYDYLERRVRQENRRDARRKEGRRAVRTGRQSHA